jgi:hypothetical protein
MFPAILLGMLFIMKCFIVPCEGKEKTAGDRYIHLHFEKGSGYSKIMQELSHGREGGSKNEMEDQSEIRE